MLIRALRLLTASVAAEGISRLRVIVYELQRLSVAIFINILQYRTLFKRGQYCVNLKQSFPENRVAKPRKGQAGALQQVSTKISHSRYKAPAL